MPEPRTRLEDLPPKARKAWTRYFELLAVAAQRKAEREAKTQAGMDEAATA